MTDNPTSSSAWLSKSLTVAVPPVVLEHIFPSHPHLTFGIGITGGVIFQHFIPPRGRSRYLFILLALAVAAAFLNATLR